MRYSSGHVDLESQKSVTCDTQVHLNPRLDHTPRISRFPSEGKENEITMSRLLPSWASYFDTPLHQLHQHRERFNTERKSHAHLEKRLP